jgi:hypothetical protein
MSHPAGALMPKENSAAGRWVDAVSAREQAAWYTAVEGAATSCERARSQSSGSVPRAISAAACCMAFVRSAERRSRAAASRARSSAADSSARSTGSTR